MTDVAKEYGTALFMLAAECDGKEEYRAALIELSALFEREPSYPMMLACPSIPQRERQAAILDAFGERLPEHVLSFLQLLCEKGRIDCFREAAEAYFALYEASLRVSDARVTSAVPLTDGEKEALIRGLEAKLGGTVRAEYFVDGALLGGVIVEVDGRIYDGSLRHRLREAKEVMKHDKT